MLDWYKFDLTHEQVKNYLESNKLDFFDTVEREDFSDFLGRTITGMRWPWNGDKDEYKNEFFKKLRENSKKCGYVWLGYHGSAQKQEIFNQNKFDFEGKRDF